jgi:hypothetical protein
MSNGERTRQAYWFGGAAVVAAGVIVCAVIAPRTAAAGWLVGFAFWSEVAVGSLLLMMIHRLTGGRWGEVLRPVIDAMAAAIPLLLVLIVPVFIAIPALYPWFHGAGDTKPDVLSHYLNTPFFVIRSLIVLAAWGVLALLLPRLAGPRGQLIAALGLAFYCLTIGPIAFDWFLSLAPPFVSSSFGASVAVTQLIAALAFALVAAPPPADESALADLGGLLLAFVLGITYIDFMVVLVIWYGDVPATTRWFVARMDLSWRALAWAAFTLAAVIPILSLFLARVRQGRGALRAVGASALLGVVCYDAYLVLPPFGAAALVPAVLSIVAIGLLLVALMRGGWRLANRRRPAYGE